VNRDQAANGDEWEDWAVDAGTDDEHWEAWPDGPPDDGQVRMSDAAWGAWTYPGYLGSVRHETVMCWLWGGGAVGIVGMNVYRGFQNPAWSWPSTVAVCLAAVIFGYNLALSRGRLRRAKLRRDNPLPGPDQQWIAMMRGLERDYNKWASRRRGRRKLPKEHWTFMRDTIRKDAR
jgi:hypothetical protein